jgi:UDP-GlcNAc:undecaprenyl-phosphate GlcNAc-1-phosphate transferase
MLGEQRELFAILIAFVAAAALTPFIRDLAHRWGQVDEPNHRSSHSAPIPRLGGIAFIIATVIGVVACTGQFEWWMLGIGLGAVLVTVSGTLDDIVDLGPAQKFLPQVGAAVVAVILLEPKILVDTPFGTFTLSAEVSAALAILWIVSVINAFNFLDGLDGLAAGVALVVAIVLASMLPGSAPLLIPFAAALGGFLLWNMAPATIFMGDGGSQFVGYLLATAVLMPGPTDTGAVPVLFAFVPVLVDAAMTIARRLTRGASPFAADRNHVFHGFADSGYSHRAVAIGYAALTGLCGLAGVAYLHVGLAGELVLLLVVAVTVGVAVAKLVPAPQSSWRSTLVTPSKDVRLPGARSRTSEGHGAPFA